MIQTSTCIGHNGPNHYTSLKSTMLRLSVIVVTIAIGLAIYAATGDNLAASASISPDGIDDVSGILSRAPGVSSDRLYANEAGEESQNNEGDVEQQKLTFNAAALGPHLGLRNSKIPRDAKGGLTVATSASGSLVSYRRKSQEGQEKEKMRRMEDEDLLIEDEDMLLEDEELLLEDRHKMKNSQDASYRPEPLALIAECLARSKDDGPGGSALGFDKISSLEQSVRIFKPLVKASEENPTEFKGDEEDREIFDASLLPHLTVLICKNTTDPCDESDPSTIQLQEINTTSIMPSGASSSGGSMSRRGTGPSGGSMSRSGTGGSGGSKSKSSEDSIDYYIALYKSTFRAYWTLDDEFSSLDLMDLRFDFYVKDLYLDSISYPIVKEKNIKPPLVFAIDSHPIIRTRILSKSGFSAHTIASHLMCEYFVTGDVILSLLYNEAFRSEDVAKALKYVYEATPQEYANWGAKTCAKSAPNTFVAEGLKDECIYDISNYTIAGEILSNAGFSVPCTYEALKVVYEVSADDAEDLMLLLGYDEDEIFETILPDRLVRYHGLIQKYGPRVYLHPNEPYKMSSIDWYLSQDMRMYYKTSKEGPDLMHNVSITRDNLYSIEKNLIEEYAIEDPKGSIFLHTVDKGIFDSNFQLSPGNQESAVAYVRAVRIKQSREVDLAFWLWYPYNGPGTMGIAVTISGSLAVGDQKFQSGRTAGNSAPLGEHPNDWEQIVVRIDENDNLVSVTCSAHGAYTKYEAGDIKYASTGSSQTIPKAYTALNGHALFSGSESGENWKTESGIDVTLVEERPFTLYIDGGSRTANFCSEGGDYLESSQNYELFGIDKYYLDTDGNIDNESWAAYSGKWGPDTEYDYDREETLDAIIEGGNLEEQLILLITKGCGVYAAPFAALFGFGYAAAFGVCMGVAAIVGIPLIIEEFSDQFFFNLVSFVIDDVIRPIGDEFDNDFEIFGTEDNFLREIVDSIEGPIGTGKTGPGLYRSVESQWFAAPKEFPQYISLQKPDKFVSGSLNISVVIADKYFKEKQFLSYIGKPEKGKGLNFGKNGTSASQVDPEKGTFTYGDAASLSAVNYGVNMDRVEIVISDGGSYQEGVILTGPPLTALFGPLTCLKNNPTCSLQSTDSAKNVLLSSYILPWDSSQVDNGLYSLRARVIGKDKRTYEYGFDSAEVEICNGPCNWINPFKLSSDIIYESNNISLSVQYRVTCQSSCTDNIELDWGDGESPTTITYANGTQTYEAEHMYAQDGTYEITFTITDSSGIIVEEENRNITVVNVAPVLEAVEISNPSPISPQSKDSAFSVSVTYNDPGQEDNHDIEINWGDAGMPTTIQEMVDASSSHTTSPVNHTYTESGVYEVSATVTDIPNGDTSTGKSPFFAVAYDASNYLFAGSGSIQVPVYFYDNTTETITEISNKTAYFGAVFENGGGGKEEIGYADGAQAFKSTSVATVTQSGNSLTARGEGKFTSGSTFNVSEAYLFEVILNEVGESFDLKVYYQNSTVDPYTQDPFFAANATVFQGSIIQA